MFLWDTPVNIVQMSGGQKRKRPDPEKVVDVLSRLEIDYATIENVHSTPNDGHVGAFTFGKVTGIVIGALYGLSIPTSEVQPAKWKYSMQVPAAKDAAKMRASQLFPHCVDGWSRAGDHGRAEAAIIALYTAIKLGLQPKQAFTLVAVNDEAPKPKRQTKVSR